MMPKEEVKHTKIQRAWSKKYPQDPYVKSYRDTNNNQVNTIRGDTSEQN